MAFSDTMDSRGRRRVVITGMGAITALGQGVDTLWRGLLEGRSGVGGITLFDPSDFPARIAAEVPALPQVPDTVGPYRIADRPYIFSCAAAQEALAMACVADSGVPTDRRAVVFSGGSTDQLLGFIAGAAARLAGADRAVGDVTPQELAPRFAEEPELGDLDHSSGSLLGPMLATLADAGAVYTLSTACAGGSQAIGNAVRLLRSGEADLALAGGCDCLVTRQIISGFSKLSALSTRNDDPTAASRPFDAERDGFVLGEGAATLVLETLDNALRRDAPILAEICGVGLSGDAYRLTDPQPDGDGMVQSMARALDDAAVAADGVDYVNAHGTSTKMNDAAETNALKRLMGDAAYSTPISSSKSMVGHPIHGAGAVESVVCVQTLRDQRIHPTANYENEDPDCDLDYVPRAARDARVDTAINNSFGFGGQNTTLVFRRFGLDL
jgi:3-oxoacyl-[acyl-carrier-protein] synthase II